MIVEHSKKSNIKVTKLFARWELMVCDAKRYCGIQRFLSYPALSGHFLVRNPEDSHKEGRPFDIHVIAEFPSLEKANEALESAEYLEIKKHRVGNSDTEYGTFVVVEGL